MRYLAAQPCYYRRPGSPVALHFRAWENDA